MGHYIIEYTPSLILNEAAYKVLKSSYTSLKETLIHMAPKRTLDDVDDAQKALEYRVAGLENKLKLLLGGTGLTFVLIVGATYWLATTLATVDTTVKTSAERVNKVYQVVWEIIDCSQNHAFCSLILPDG